MKKALSLLLALVMCLSLVACGGGNDTPKEDETETTTAPSVVETTEPEPTEPNIEGTYKTANIFDTTYILNENTTYDIISESRPYDEGKGTYSVLSNGDILLKDVDGGEHNFRIKDGYLYRTDALSYFDKDEEYGLGLSLDSQGRTNQQFDSQLIYSNGDRHFFSLTLNSDGTCIVGYNVIANKGMGDRLVTESYDGTYSVKDNIMTVNYNGDSHIMLIEDGILYFYVVTQAS